MTVANGLMNNVDHRRSILTRPELPGAYNPAAHFLYTTGRVSKICRVAPRTVSKWIDSGKLQGYRLPGSQDRRVNGVELLKFMRAYGMIALIPTELLRADAARPVAILYPIAEIPRDVFGLHGFSPVEPKSEIELGAWVSQPINAQAIVVIGTGHGTAVALKTVVEVRRMAPRATVAVTYTLADIGEQGFLSLEVVQPRVPLIESSTPEQFCVAIARLITGE